MRIHSNNYCTAYMKEMFSTRARTTILVMLPESSVNHIENMYTPAHIPAGEHATVTHLPIHTYITRKGTCIYTYINT